jgi:hypothetical protein
MTEKPKTYADIRKIDVSEHIEKKNNLSYLSWAWAVDTLFLHDNDAEWEYLEPTVFHDGTVMVHCVVTAFGKKRKAHLPVMDYKNQAIPNPGAFQMNTAMQRCLVKAIAHHGLGLYIYAGEDLPEGSKEKEITLEQKQFERDFSYNLALCKTVEEIEELSAEHGDLPDVLTDSISMRIKGLKAGTVFPPAVFGFVSVAEALDFGKNAKQTIDGSKLEYLEQWMQDNDHKIKALDKTLKAAVYNKDGSPSERLFKAYEDRLKKESK